MQQAALVSHCGKPVRAWFLIFCSNERNKYMMMLTAKAACLAIYAMALFALTGFWSSGLAQVMQIIALVLLLVHALELVFVFKHVRLYRGALIVSLGLTMLFGLLHWKPLAAKQAQRDRLRRLHG